MTNSTDLVVSVIYHSGLRKFAANRKLLHCVFCDVKQENPELFAAMNFEYEGLFPFSNELDKSLSELEIKQVLKKEGKTYLVSSKINDIHKEAAHRITQSRNYCCPYCVWYTGMEFRKQLG